MDLLNHPSRSIIQTDPFLQELGVCKDYVEKVIKIMCDPACQLSDRLHLLRLPKTFVHFFGTLSCGNITDIALNHALAIFPVHIADKLYVDGTPTPGFEGKILVSDVFLVLQCSKSRFRCLDVLERANLPKRLTNKFISRIVQ